MATDKIKFAVVSEPFSDFKSPELRTGIFLLLPDFHQGQCTQRPKKHNITKLHISAEQQIIHSMTT